MGEREDERGNKEGREIGGTVALLRCLFLRGLIVPMSLARNEAPMKEDPSADEHGADERFQPIEHQHRARGPVADKPAGGRNGVEPEGGDERAHWNGEYGMANAECRLRRQQITSHEGHEGLFSEFRHPFVRRCDRCVRSSAGLEFVDCAEVMVVVLGHEEAEIDDGHGLAQPRMQRRASELGRAHPRELLHDAAADGAEVREDVGDRTIVVSGVMGLAILEIGWVQLGSARVVIIEPLVPQRFEIEEMAGIFLDRPLALVLSRQHFWRQSADGAGEACGRTSQAFEKFGRCIRAEAELKFAVEPPSLRRHTDSLIVNRDLSECDLYLVAGEEAE
jgi:hypothetical protein